MFERLINWAYQKQEAKRRQQKMQRIQSVLSKNFTLSRQTNFNDMTDAVEAFRQPKNKLKPGDVTITVPETGKFDTPIHPRGEIQKAIYHLGRLRKDYQNQADYYAEDSDFESEMNAQADKVRDIMGTLKELESSMVSESEKRRELARAAIARDKVRRAAGARTIRRVDDSELVEKAASKGNLLDQNAIQLEEEEMDPDFTKAILAEEAGETDDL